MNKITLSIDEAQRLIGMTAEKELLVKMLTELDVRGLENIQQIKARIEVLRQDIVSMLSHV